MKTKLGIRIVSLTLALELAMSPVAMAWAAFPAQELRPETPLGEEVTLPQEENEVREQPVSATLDEGGTAGVGVLYYSIAPNVETKGHTSQDLSSRWFSLESALARLNVELAQEDILKGGTLLWGGGGNNLATGYPSSGDASYVFLPDLTAVGRVPDMVVDGYYIEDRPVGEANETEVSKEDASPEKLEWESESISGNWDNLQGKVYRLDGTYSTTAVSGDPMVTIEARWKASPYAQVTALAMDAHTDAQATTDRVTRVTQVYTEDPLQATGVPATMALDNYTAALGAQPPAKSGADGENTGDTTGETAGGTTTTEVKPTDLAAHEMWLWVGKDQTSLDLHFQTYEPYIDYTKDKNPDPEYDPTNVDPKSEPVHLKEYAAPPVQVSYAFDDGAATGYTLTKGGNLECFYTPGATQDVPTTPDGYATYAYTAQNSPEKPARGQWTVKGIPLTRTGEDEAVPDTVTVTLTVAAPDGEEKNAQTYTLHIQRRKDPTGSMSFGNTPMGMIQRCDEGYWGTEDKATKATAVEYFINNKNFAESSIRPGGTVNQRGHIYRTAEGTSGYSATAWSQYGGAESNVDLDDTAVVAYLDSAFEDPGVSFVDSIGRPYVFGSGQGTVTRTIKLKRPIGGGSLSTDCYIPTIYNSEDCWYTVSSEGKGSLSDTKASQTLQTGKDLVDLRGLNVIPGVYEMVYTYQDALTSATDATGADNTPTYTSTVTRTLVVLPIPGDVDMDGAVTVADAATLRENLADWNKNDSSAVLRLVKARVFDVDGNGSVTETGDVSKIEKGYQPFVENGDRSDYFYLPLPGGTEAGRKTWSQVKDATGGGTLSLVYLGVETGTRGEAYTENPGGPWATKQDGAGNKVPVSLPKTEDGETTDNSVFWMGVNLDGVTSKDLVEEFSFSLIYDSAYVEPVGVYTAAERDTEVNAGHSFDGWMYTMRKYNLQDGAETIWEGTSGGYNMDASNKGRPFQTHYTKVISQLESTQTAGQASTLKELVFTLRSIDLAKAAKWGSGYILVAPFRLKVHPQGATDGSARLIELGPGMRDFTLVTSGVTRSAGGKSTAAFSAQDEIFGGSTRNLRSEIQTDPGKGMVPIGADNTERKTLPTGKYGEPYQANNVGSGQRDTDGLPPGLEYNVGYKRIEGTPTEPGTYNCTVNGILYTITIQTKDLHYRPVEAVTYYGENEYRGAWDDPKRAEGYAEAGYTPRDFTFQYNARDLCEADRERLGITLSEGNEPVWRAGTELATLWARQKDDKMDCDYAPPAFAAYTSNNYIDDNLVTQRTPVTTATYIIHTQKKPVSTVYSMVESETAVLKISRRPVFIDHVVAEKAVISIFADAAGSFDGIPIEEKDGNGNVIDLCHTNGQYEMPLTGDAKVAGDKLSVTISGSFHREEKDKNGFTLSAPEEERSLDVTDIHLIENPGAGFQNQNYNLSKYVVEKPTENDIKGTVRVKNLVSLSIGRVPSYFDSVQTYGERMVVLDGLSVSIRQDGDTVSTSYFYNADLPRRLGVHFNWVSPEEYDKYHADDTTYLGSGYDPEKGDLRPYAAVGEDGKVHGYLDGWFYPDMDGYMICACVPQLGENGRPTYLKRYSKPIRIQKKSLTITPDVVSRYYGEKLSPTDLTYSFLVSGLANRDIKSSYGKGNAAVLAEVLREDATFRGFQMETVEKVDDGWRVIDEKAPVKPSGTYWVRISGGESSRYTFVYEQLDATGKKVVDTSATEGFAPLNIKPRPIVVQSITGNNADGTFCDIYADTKNLTVTGLTADLDHVTFAAPPTNGEGDFLYYTETSAHDAYKDAGTYTYSDEEPVVVPGEDLKVKYQITFLPDETHFVWTNFTTNYFENDQFDSSETGMVEKPVEVHKLELTGANAANYKLVYADTYSAGYRAPSEAAKEINQKKAPEFNGPGAINREVVTYLVSGNGRVHLRPIAELELSDLGQMSYAYGDGFAPGQPGEGTGSQGLTVRVKYATDFDNWPSSVYGEKGNVTQEDVVFYDNYFAQRGFAIYYAKPGQTQKDVAEGKYGNQELHAGDIMVPADHDGASLFVTGRRSERDPIKYAQVAPDKPDMKNVLRVSKRSLTLTPQDGHKIYGENNPSFTYTFDVRQLADVDRDRLAGMNGVTLPDDNMGAPSLLQKLDPTGYGKLNGIRYTTEAEADSPVYPADGERGYPVTMTLPRENGKNVELSNYTLSVAEKGCNLYIYPRPVTVTGVRSVKDFPAYTIFNDTTQQEFKTNLNTAAEGCYVTVGCGVSTVTTATTLVNGDLADLPITNTVGLVNGDVLTFNVTVGYPKDWKTRLGSATDLTLDDAYAVVTGVRSNENYSVLYSTDTYPTWAEVKLRTISAIHIKGRPTKMDYTYQESLDLTGLQVQVDYKKVHAQESGVESKTFDYIGEDQFHSIGLYVNYWGGEDVVPGVSDQSALKALPGSYRVARSGDHLTIAPTHDTQSLPDGGNTARNGNRFYANGKYLIISAFQAGPDQTAAQPVVLGAVSEQYWEGTPIPITVKPLRLHYTLSATDKTYDGTKETAGSITLTNLFQKTGKVDEYNTAGVTDTVYVPVGAPYETGSDDHNDYAALKGMTQSGQVTFTTGSYTGNEDPPLLKNGFITWKYSGYKWGEHLTFSFANENVHYVDDLGVSGVGSEEKASYWRTTQAPNTVDGRWDTFPEITSMPVEVTHIGLYGPDAANYTWGETDGTHVTQTQVMMETRSRTENGQAATPFATIHKANRALIQESTGEYPTVQVDIHTNVVRVFFRDAILDSIAAGWNNNNLAGTQDVFRGDELHFEYALAYQDQDGLYRQWAGKDGTLDYQDTTFFGGEAVTPAIAQGYVPDVDRLPKEENANERTVYKGQRYPADWLAADTGLSAKGYRVDSGFRVNGAAYPGGASYVDAFWNYELYITDRKNLPRNTVFYPLVRLAETHNYNPSGDLTGFGDKSVSAATLDAARKAVAALEADPENEDLLAEAKAKSAAVFAEGQKMTDAAKADAQAKVDFDAALGESLRYPEEPPAPNWAPNVAVKTFTQRLDILSSEETQSADDPTARYVVETLEAVWFTDTLVFDKEQYLSAVVYNNPTRYYSFFWDKDLSAAIQFNEKALNFTEEITDIRIRERLEDGTMVEKYITVNQFDESVGGRVAKLYAQIEPNDNNKLRSLQILPRGIFARLGDAPRQLQLVTVPALPSNRRYTWTTSDPAVATVDESGLVTFRGVGTCTISVAGGSGHKNRRDSITVTVLPAVPALTGAESLFDHTLADRPWMGVDYRGAFRPHAVMTRAQVVLLLDQFLRRDAGWQPVTELPYRDVTGEESYADALRRLTGAGVVTGVPGSAFVGSQPITRAELATMLARMLRLRITDTRGTAHMFEDATAEDTWAYAYIDAIGKTGLMRGVGGGNFAPSRVITREEAAAVIARMLTVQLPEGQTDLLSPTDMTPENWSYNSVLRALNAVIFPD